MKYKVITPEEANDIILNRFLEKNMPLTKAGKEVLAKMTGEYGTQKAQQVFYASINKKKAGSNKWEGKTAKKKRSGK